MTTLAIRAVAALAIGGALAVAWYWYNSHRGPWL